MSEHPPTPETHQPTRREFLVKSAALAGAASLMASCTGPERIDTPPANIPERSRDRTPLADGDPVRMAVIGTGGMGTGHVNSFLAFNDKNLEKVHIVALADVCQSRLERAQRICDKRQEHKVDIYRDYQELLARDDIHGVLIASPEHWHAQMAEDALLAGKDVYLEKPMTLDLPDALRLRQVVHANPEMILQVGTQKIMLPKYREAQKLIAEGAIGKPTFSQTSYCRNSKDGEWLYYKIDPKWEPGVNLDWDAWCGKLGPREWDPEVYARWRRYKDFSTGIIGDLLVHEMTPLVMALDVGWPTRVVASGGHYVDKAMENHDQVNLTIEFEQGHTMIVAGSTCNEVGLENMVRGHQANLYLNSRHCEIRPERLFSEDIDPRKVECKDIGNDQNQLRLNWLRCIRTREHPDSDVELGTKIMVIVDLAARSMWEGHAYRFDPSSLSAQAV